MRYITSGNCASALPLDGFRVYCPQYPPLAKASHLTDSGHRVLHRVALVRTPKGWGKVIFARTAHPAQGWAVGAENMPCNGKSSFWD